MIQADDRRITTMNDMEFAGVILCPVGRVRSHSVEFRSHSVHQKWEHDAWRRLHDAMLRFRPPMIASAEEGSTMARIYRPLERKEGGRWDMVVSSDDEGWSHAIGYCAGWREFSIEELRGRWGDRAESVQAELEVKRLYIEHYHSNGHGTAEEAYACYQRFGLDQELQLNREHPDEQRRCMVCGVWTNRYASLGDETERQFDLCDSHRTRPYVEQLLTPPAE